MRAIGYFQPHALSESAGLTDIDIPKPEPSGRDLLVEVHAVSVNPVDVKLRATVHPANGHRILGWDAAGVVVAVGEQARLFVPGDRVFYAGAIDRQGCNAEFHIVDERIVGKMPTSLSYPQAAALPLTAITAWEALFERLDIARPVPGAAKVLVVIGAAGGVGSIIVQLARELTDLTVIASASRPESAEWVRDMGAHFVIDHSRPMADQIRTLGVGQPAFVFCTSHSEKHLAEIAEMIAPQGRFALIDDPEHLNILPFKAKSVSIHWEFMFTRSLMKTADVEAQHTLLNRIAALVDEGRIRSTLRETLCPFDAITLRQAHARVETNRMIGKVVVAGFP